MSTSAPAATKAPRKRPSRGKAPTTKAAARAAIEANTPKARKAAATNKVEPKVKVDRLTREPVNTEADSGLSVAAIAAMDKVERLNAAKPESVALREWKKGGSKGPRPSTPILDWMNNPTVQKAHKATKIAGGANARTEEQQARLVEIIGEARTAGDKWHQAAKKLTAEGIPTSRGGGWYYSTVQLLAKSIA